MDTSEYWAKQHDKYAAADWIDKPSLFAMWAIDHFPPEGKILELGAGQAQDSRYFYENGYQVTATDFSDRALEIAGQKSPVAIQFQEVDLSQPMPFEDESFDVVYSHLAMHYFDQATTERLFDEVHRVLKMGGVLIALFNSTNDPEMLEGEEIEPNFIEIDGIRKRYFNSAMARDFAKNFEIHVADHRGTSHKDSGKLVRLVAEKSGNSVND